MRWMCGCLDVFERGCAPRDTLAAAVVACAPRNRHARRKVVMALSQRQFADRYINHLFDDPRTSINDRRGNRFAERAKVCDDRFDAQWWATD